MSSLVLFFIFALIANAAIAQPLPSQLSFAKNEAKRPAARNARQVPGHIILLKSVKCQSFGHSVATRYTVDHHSIAISIEYPALLVYKAKFILSKKEKLNRKTSLRPRFNSFVKIRNSFWSCIVARGDASYRLGCDGFLFSASSSE